MSDLATVDVVVVGAGTAGLAAAAQVRSAGRSCIVLEASGRIGGRAYTTHPTALGGLAFDHGATWLHAAEHNPLVPLARAAGIGLSDSATTRHFRSRIGDRWASEDEMAAYGRAEEQFARAMRTRAEGPDVSVLDAFRTLPPDPWMATVLTWESSIIAAAEAADLSLHDWAANLLEGTNLEVAGGVGALVARVLGPPAGDVRLRSAVRRIEWDGLAADGAVRVTTDAGVLTAGAAIVTVSTGVLASGAIAFSPRLPAATAAAIAQLPMGLLTKVLFPARPGDRLGVPDSTVVDRQVASPGEAMPTVQMWPGGRDMVTVFLNGRHAWELAREGEGAAEAFAREWLRRLLGGGVDAVLRPACVVTGWGRDPLFLGAYAYATPGFAGARAALAAPVGEGRLLFAGEACHVGLAGTVAGAWLSGRAAAEEALARLGAQ